MLAPSSYLNSVLLIGGSVCSVQPVCKSCMFNMPLAKGKIWMGIKCVAKAVLCLMVANRGLSFSF